MEGYSHINYGPTNYGHTPNIVTQIYSHTNYGHTPNIVTHIYGHTPKYSHTSL